MRKKHAVCLLTLALIMMSMPVATPAQTSNWGLLAEHVYATRISPLAYNVDYNGSTKILQIELYHPEQYEALWLRGMQVIEIVFNVGFKPTSITAVYVNGSDVFDMLYVHPTYNAGNTFFYEDVHHWRKNDTSETNEWYYAEAIYLLAFIYTFQNHTVDNLDYFMANNSLQYWNRPWIDGPNDTSSQNESMSAFSLANNDFSLSNIPTNVDVNVDFNEEITIDTPTINLLLITGSIGLVVMAIVIVVWFGRKQA